MVGVVLLLVGLIAVLASTLLVFYGLVRGGSASLRSVPPDRHRPALIAGTATFIGIALGASVLIVVAH
jgi:hypothetical protein